MKRNNMFGENHAGEEHGGTLVCDEIEDAGEVLFGEVEERDVFPDNVDLPDIDTELLEVGEEHEDARECERTEDLVRSYFNSMGDIAVLTKKEETELAKKVEEGKRLIREIVCSLPVYKKIEADIGDDRDEESASKALEMSLTVLDGIMEKAGTADRTDNRRPESGMTDKIEALKGKWGQITEARRSIAIAKDELIVRNLRLVITIAKHYVGRGLPLLDLIQEGNIGLMKAVDRFKYEMGFKFSTYATWWIRQAITRAIMEQGKTIRVPVHIVEFHNRVAKASRELTQELGREPGNREIAKRLGVPIKKVEEVCKAIRTPVALETPVGAEDSVIGDFIGDRGSPLPDAGVERKEISKHLLKILKTLTYREEKVIRMRFGIGAERDHTLEEVGRRLSITRERVRQIEVQAMRKLRHPSRLQTLQQLGAL
ncbi:MAG: RNA polymerase sigma factor RpoD/SigA [Acidobacteriota bacterium]